MIDHGLGQIIPAEAEHRRDAIHVAICPCVAGTILNAGEHVSFTANGIAVAHYTGNPTVGVVDPFLKSKVGINEKFWLFLYPNSVRGLRHEWHHPSIPDHDAAALAKALAPERVQDDEDDGGCSGCFDDS